MIRNNQIADLLDEIADLLDLQQANPFRIRAYRNAARLLRGLQREAADMLAKGEKLEELPGIGADLAGKIRDVVETGGTELLYRLRRELPHGLVELLRVPGLGPKRARLLHDQLRIASLAGLRAAARTGKLAKVKGLGAKTQATILAATEAPAPEKRVLRWRARPAVDSLLAHLKTGPGVKQAAVAGSYRRARDTVGDIDIVATASDGAKVIAHFVAHEDVAKVLAQGGTRATVLLRDGLQVDLRVVEQDSFGAAMVYFTGSKAHNIAIRRLAQQRKLKINEYGVFRGAKRVAGTTEESVYKALGLPLIAPELREDRGEIAAAAARRLPELVERGDLKGDLHSHTKASDGQASLEEMVAAARSAGLRYLAITEHSQRLTVAHGLDRKRLQKQLAQIDALNAKLRDFRILKGIEVDILEDGRLDLPDAILGELDLVVAAIHSHFDLTPEKQTTRLLRAMDRPRFSILAHPTSRLIGEREGCRFDMARVIKAAAQRGCFLELNAQPERLDLTDIQCQAARAAGVLVSIGSDAHRPADFDFLAYGVGQARRGWLTAADVLNTRPLSRLLPLLKRTMG
ncbi:MAG TPA: DNA polymerase/3'-5' exonuclease PolX [Alphaproteobacteria bacterium]|nr:DNA polymerase/3'-5' exonuclease PolX [Alphaproteobacteria bacterium]